MLSVFLCVKLQTNKKKHEKLALKLDKNQMTKKTQKQKPEGGGGVQNDKSF